MFVVSCHYFGLHEMQMYNVANSPTEHLNVQLIKITCNLSHLCPKPLTYLCQLHIRNARTTMNDTHHTIFVCVKHRSPIKCTNKKERSIAII